MKKLTIISALLCLGAQQLFAQKDIELKFDNGETKTFRFDYDDPEILPKWGVDVRFFGLSFFRAEAIGPRISPYYRVNYKLTLQGNLAIPYSIGLDGNTYEGRAAEDGAKSAMDWSLMSHYIIFSKDHTKEKNVAVDFGSSGSASIIYKAKLPRTIKRNIAVDAGFGNYRYYKDAKLENVIPTNTGNMDSFYYVGMVANTGLHLGLSYFKSESYKMTTDDVTRTYWNTRRIFCRLSLGLGNQYSITKEGKDVDKDATGFVQPEKSPLGYRIGMDRNLGVKNSGCSFSWGFEFGTLSGLKINGYKNSIFMVHFGFGLAPKPSQL